MHCTAKIIKDSMIGNSRLTTFELRYPRFVHSELMTHRVFSRNAMSSRAVPVKKMLEQVRSQPAAPSFWGKNQKGMQAYEELPEPAKTEAQRLWLAAAKMMADVAETMMELDMHKQDVNRILEPFQYIVVIVTATEYSNWFALRNHEAAHPTIQELAREMQAVYEENEPELIGEGMYHLPYIKDEEWYDNNIEDLTKFSAARCARVSYLTHEGKNPTRQEDLDLYDRLSKAVPPHLSPLEHQATPAWGAIEHDFQHHSHNGNFNWRWVQFRKAFEINKPELFWDN